MTINSILEAVDECQLEKDQPVLIGVSGGIDSLALMHILISSGYQVIVAHFNHHLRPDADDDARFVKEIAEDSGCKFVCGEADVSALAEQNKISIEAAARDARYQYLFTQAEALGAQAVAVGHNADDQVETVLMHILRGSSLSGLAGMRPRVFLHQYSSVVPLVRPLLNVWRADLDLYCQEAGLNPRFDLTNEDIRYTRNRIRHELLPILAGYNSKIKERLRSLTFSVQNSLEILENAVDLHYQDTLRSSGEGYRGFERKVISGLGESMQLEIIHRAALELLGQSEDLDQAALQRAVMLLKTMRKDRRTDLADGLYAQTDADRFYVAAVDAKIQDTRFPQLLADEPCVLNVPGRVMLDNGWVIRAMWLEKSGTIDIETLKTDPSNVVIDADTIELPLTIRRKMAGDRFQPLGLGEGSVKVGDYFTNIKLPSLVRQKWPLILSGNMIIWITGCQIADSVKIKSNSRRFVRLRLERMINNE